ACGVRAGMAECWGSEGSGGLADGFWGHYQLPLDQANVIGPADAIVMGTGKQYDERDENVCMRLGTQVSCWGADVFGQLGQGVATRHPTPIEIRQPSPSLTWKSVIAGRYHACATTSDGALWCWGYDGRGEV